MTKAVERAEALKHKLATDLGDLVEFVTIDGAGLKPQTRAAVVVLPPDLSYPNFSEVTYAFKLAVVASPPNNPFLAWQRIDLILDKLHELEYNLETAKPASFDLAGGGFLTAYEVTLNEE